jgi:hypothetical protein
VSVGAACMLRAVVLLARSCRVIGERQSVHPCRMVY